MDLNELLERWKREPSIFSNISSWKQLPPLQPQYSDFPQRISPTIIKAFTWQGIYQLYQHQTDAINFALEGRHVLITTGTASGKSLCYNTLVLNELIQDPHATALYIFPTKALAHDQAVKLRQLLNELSGEIDFTPQQISQIVGVYDGDTPYHSRKSIRDHSNLIFTNPDMLHAGILPHHPQWYRFFSGLKYVIIDEIHIYRGVFGSHIANVLRRLKRIASHYGSTPQFILTTGTISNPEEFATRLIEEPVSVVNQDSSPKGFRNIMIYNPPLVNDEFGIRLHPFNEAKRFVRDLSSANIQTIIFCQSRKAVENLLIDIRNEMGEENLSNQNIISGYRSGYLPENRRNIEKEFRNGSIRTIITTNALELGIDIGELEATILVGFPGTISSTWQQIGRSGRSGRSSIGILILSSSPLDQYLAKNPQYFWDRSPEQALINPDNPLILFRHLQCALNEIPFRQLSFGKANQELLETLLSALVANGIAVKSSKGEFFYAGSNARYTFSIRTNSQKQINLFVENNQQRELIGEVDDSSADWLVHPGAVYLHQGEIYLVTELNNEKNEATLIPTDVEYYTQPLLETQITHFKVIENVSKPNQNNEYFQWAYAEINLTYQLTGYNKISWNTNRILEKIPYSLPPRELATNAFCIFLNESLINELRLENQWSADPNYYGANWKDLKLIVRQRDEYRCRICGKVETDKAHDVHHIKPFRNFSTPAEANQLSNLITLCKNCHQLVERSVRVQSGLSALGYALRHIAPLFAMCDPHDIGVHIDPKFKFVSNMAAIVVYENIAGGIGICQQFYTIAPKLVSSVSDHISRCSCSDGCPSCTGPILDGGRSGKQEALAILTQMVKYG